MDRFAAGLEDIAAAITRRDAEARASCKRPLPVPVCARQQRLEGLQQRFKMWCANDLHGAVRHADTVLARVRWRMEQTMAPLPGCHKLDLSPETVVAQTTIALWREGDRHLLTVTLQGDGVVRAVPGGPAGRVPDEPYPDATEKTLDAGYARVLVLTFTAQAVKVPQERPLEPGPVSAGLAVPQQAADGASAEHCAAGER